MVVRATDDHAGSFRMEGGLLSFWPRSKSPRFPRQAKPGRRGEVKCPNRLTRQRNRKAFLRLDFPSYLAAGNPLYWVTLTFPQASVSPAEAKRALERFFKRLARRRSRAALAWIMEPQARGVPHFHAFVFNLDAAASRVIPELWADVIGDNPTAPGKTSRAADVRRIAGPRDFLRCLLYTTGDRKQGKADGVGAQLPLTTLDIGIISCRSPFPPASADWGPTGRTWDFKGKKYLPRGKSAPQPLTNFQAWALKRLSRAFGYHRLPFNDLVSPFCLFLEDPALIKGWLEGRIPLDEVIEAAHAALREERTAYMGEDWRRLAADALDEIADRWAKESQHAEARTQRAFAYNPVDPCGEEGARQPLPAEARVPTAFSPWTDGNPASSGSGALTEDFFGARGEGRCPNGRGDISRFEAGTSRQSDRLGRREVAGTKVGKGLTARRAAGRSSRKPNWQAPKERRWLEMLGQESRHCLPLVETPFR